jgi:hypothetical protein
MLARVAFAIAATAITAAGMASCNATQPDQVTTQVIDPVQGPAALDIRRRAVVWGAGPAYTILLDGQPIAQLEAGEIKTVQVPAGVHAVEVRCGGETSGTAAQAHIVLGAGRSYQMDVYQIDDDQKQPICQLRTVGS